MVVKHAETLPNGDGPRASEALSLSVRLREGTREEHTRTESAPFIRCFWKGRLDRASYVHYLESLYWVYLVMESELGRHAADPVLGRMQFPELLRSTALADDVAFWGARLGDPSPATQTYVARIRDVSETAPALLVAHSYTRYLGDVSGGQILKGLVRRTFGLSATEGTAFYEFAQIPNLGAFKTLYRETLDGLPLDEPMLARVVREARVVFELNHQVFVEREPSLKAALGDEAYLALVSEPVRPTRGEG